MQLFDSVASEPSYSFEFFPPKSDDGWRDLETTLNELETLRPSFVSITYGAGGSTRRQTVELVRRLGGGKRFRVVAHLTAAGHSRDEISSLVDALREAGVNAVLALRGDAPPGQVFEPAKDGFRYAADLIHFIRQQHPDLPIGGAFYPEGHLETTSKEIDRQHFADKVAAGLTFAVSQLFFDNAFYFDFMREIRAMGVTIPLFPGLMPITNLQQVQRFTRLCGATVPMKLQLALEQASSPEATVQLGVAHATAQSVQLLQRGAPGIHFYTLNRSPAARMIVSALRAVPLPPPSTPRRPL